MNDKKIQNRFSRGGGKPFWKKWWFWVIVVVMAGGAFTSNKTDTEPQEDAAAIETVKPAETDNTDTEQTQTEEAKQEITHIYDNAVIKDVMNGSRTEKIGEYSVIKAASDQITEESLADWYFNYVSKNNFNWCVILYTDKNTNEGVFSNGGYISKDVILTVDEYGDYVLGDTSKCVTYFPDEKGQLKESYSATEGFDNDENINIDTFIEEVKNAIQGTVGEDEMITDVQLENDDLRIYVDFSKTEPSPLTLEDLALHRTSSITDGILELKRYDSIWNTITVEFKDIGYVRNSKENIKYNEFGRYFDSANFKIE